MSYCSLNNVKHRAIIDDMVDKGLIERFEEPWGNKTIIKYKVSEKGRAIFQEILEPYEVLGFFLIKINLILSYLENEIHPLTPLSFFNFLFQHIF
jgi:hypothetical protein